MKTPPGPLYPDCSVPGDTVGIPAVIPYFDDEAALDAFVEDLSRATGETPRRLGGTRARPSADRRVSGQDRRRPEEPPRIDLVLYTSPESEKSQRAVRAVQEVLKRYNVSQVRFATCDLSTRPQEGEVDSVVFTPTLVKKGPGPKTAIIGNLEREDVLCDLLDASGVDRRWDD